MERGLNIDTARKREQRQDLAALAHPQEGVDHLSSAFPGATQRPEGVVNRKRAA